MFSYSQEILVENGWIFQTIRDISDDIGKPKTYNAPCLQISLQLNIQFQLIPKNADVRAGQRMGTVKWGTRKAGYIGLCPEGIAWLVPWYTERERALTTLPGRPSHAFSGMRSPHCQHHPSQHLCHLIIQQKIATLCLFWYQAK